MTTTYDLCYHLAKVLNADDILLVGCSCMAFRVFDRHYKEYGGKAEMQPSDFAQGSMGASIPVAIGISLASGRRVIVVDGDGSFCQNTQELEVVHRLHLNIIFFIVNNGGYASIRNSETRAFGRLSGADDTSGLSLPEIRGIAKAYKLDYTDFNPMFSSEYLVGYKSIKYNGAAVVEVRVPHDEQPPARE